MSDQVQEQPQEGAEPEASQVEAPAVEAEEFDKERALETIKKLRQFEKQSKALERKLAEYEAKEREREESKLSETEKLKRQLAEKEAALQSLERAAMQRKAAEAAGLPPAFAERLKGETQEELEADAKALKEVLPKAQAPNVGTTNPGSNATGQGETLEQRRARVYGGAVDIFDPATVAKLGGGVVTATKTND